MKYDYIEVYRYIRIEVSGHDFVRIDFVNKVQLLLGTNGSGKSSLMKEISVLPATPSEYKAGGYKEVGVTHNGHTYVIRSDFTKGARHSFIKDGEELNPGGTATVARNLAFQEFGITPEIHSINCGITNFHTMDVNARRNWFTRIGKEDYTYALSYFKKLKDHLRDIQGYLKQIKGKLFTEKNNLISDEKKHELIMDLKLTNAALDSVLSRKVSIEQDDVEMFTAIERQQDELETVYRKIMRLHGVHLGTLSAFDSEEHMLGRMNEMRAELGAIGLTINQLTEGITQTRKILEQFSDVKDTNEEEAKKQVEALTAQIDEAVSGLPNKPEVFLEQRFYDDLILKVSACYASMTEALGNIVPDPENIYTAATYETCIRDVRLINDNLQAIAHNQTTLIRRKTELEHLKGHDKTRCPQCSHEWYLGYSEKEYTRTLEGLAELDIQEKKNQAALKEKQDLQELIVNRNNWQRTFVGYANYIDDDRLSFKRYLTFLCDFNKEPAKARQFLEDFTHDLNDYSKIAGLKERLVEQQKILDKIIEVKSGDIETANKQLAASENELVAAVQRQRQLQVELSILVECEKAVRLMQRYMDETDDLYSQILKTNDSLVLFEEQKILNNMIRDLRLKISAIELALNDAKNQEQSVKNLEAEIEEKTRVEVLLAEAVRSLSPTEGIIAKSLVSFMDQFVNNMNLFIKEIWTYPLEIQSLLPDGEDVQELDFKFSVSANGGTPIPDVAFGSSGMREIFNMAFKIVSLQHSGLADGPIYLDEFGNALDEKHRATAQFALLELMQSSEFSQVFMISHDKGSYGNLRNTDVNVLCSRNVAIGDGEVYNVNMRTKR